MITGRQIREARALLKWSPARLAEASGLGKATVERAESVDGEPPLTIAQLATIRRAREAAGVEFTEEESGVRLKQQGGKLAQRP
jgi:transcriptional regulator with XRE-family HTH domain